MSEQIKCPGCGGEHFLVSHDARMTLVASVETDDDGDFVYRAAEDEARYQDVEENYTLKCTTCDFSIEGPPEKWGDAFFPKPDIEGLLALRARMKGDAPASSGDEVADQGAST